MDSGDEYEDEAMHTEMLEDIHDGSKSYLSVNSRESRYKISVCIKKEN